MRRAFAKFLRAFAVLFGNAVVCLFRLGMMPAGDWNLRSQSLLARTGSTINRHFASIDQIKARLLFASSFLADHPAVVCSECLSFEQSR